ncbi:MAG: CRISPR-associated endonuclease Cas2 [Candidatus Baltobacteraceae bacterium]
MLRAYLLSYDIANPKRLRQMHKLATAFGRPLQYSVFACLLRREDRVRLAARIESVIDSRSDRVIILDMGTVTDRESWIPPMQIFGCQETIQERSALIV